MTKIDGQTKKAARSNWTRSLRRLQTDHIDLLQFHEVIRDTDPARIFGEGGSMEACWRPENKAKSVTSDSPDTRVRTSISKMLETAFAHQFTFDAVQMPLNVMDAHYDSFERTVLPVLVKHDIGVLGMKPMGDNVILRSKTASAYRMSALCHEPAHQRGHHRLRIACRSCSRRSRLPEASKPWVRKRSLTCWPEPRLRPARENSSATRRRTTSTEPTNTRSGWAEICRSRRILGRGTSPWNFRVRCRVNS